jgi:hypothetical protein
MLLQKTFHIHKDISATKTRLANLQYYRRHLEGVEKAVITADGVAQFEFVAGNGFHGHFVTAELPTEDANQVLFQTTAGNVEIAGLIEFFEVRADLTEVQLTAEYTIKSPVHRLLDRLTGGIERFVNSQLRRLQAALDNAPFPAPAVKKERRSFSAHLTQLLAH